jgi:hypothetical protein
MPYAQHTCWCCAGLLQKDNPEVAMKVKTRQAIRTVLNNMRDEVHTLLQDGLLEEAEGLEIAGVSRPQSTAVTSLSSSFDSSSIFIFFFLFFFFFFLFPV